jgi:hypothetical protein
MKFYREKKNQYIRINYILYNRLTAIYSYNTLTQFYRNGVEHNSKNASHVMKNSIKEFYLDGKYFGCSFFLSRNKFNLNQKIFDKQSWRRFVKLQAFL